MRAEGDLEKSRQILLNLLTNALKFTEPGGRVAVDWHPAGGMVEIDVQDTGIGIAADRLETTFEPFLQLDPDLTRDRPGTGLGLSISRELARGMGGEITVRSMPGTGSTFSFTVPRAGGGSREGE